MSAKLDPVTYFDEYKNKSKPQLREIKKSLVGHFGEHGGIPEARAAAVEMVIAGLAKTKKGVIKSLSVCDDVRIAHKYVAKKSNAFNRGFDFTLTFSEYKRIATRKTCYYTGIRLTDDDDTSPNHRTIDRIDNSKGYVSGNCVACSNLANSIKAAVIENPSSKMVLTVAQFKQMAAKL
jgi:hypothetical protein